MNIKTAVLLPTCFYFSVVHATPEEENKIILNALETQQIINECLQLSTDNADPQEILDCVKKGTGNVERDIEYIDSLEEKYSTQDY